MKKLTVLLAVLVAAMAYGQELLTNGDFELPLETGWIVDSGEYGYKYVDRDTGYHPDPDYEAFDSIYAGNGFVSIGQVVDVPGIVLLLTFDASFAIGGGSSTCWPVAYVGISYYDNTDTKLGETRICYRNSYCTWTPSPTLSLTDITNPDWTTYTVNIVDELGERLPGVNPGDVARIGVALVDTTAGG
jgi:hypothetical protein